MLLGPLEGVQRTFNLLYLSVVMRYSLKRAPRCTMMSWLHVEHKCMPWCTSAHRNDQ